MLFLRYMLYTVGYLWKVFGVSWKSLAILILVMLGISAFAVYGISRLAMPVPWSVFVALAFTWNSAVYSQMPLFRDFSKAPFILVTVFLLARFGALRFLLAVFGLLLPHLRFLLGALLWARRGRLALAARVVGITPVSARTGLGFGLRIGRAGIRFFNRIA